MKSKLLVTTAALALMISAGAYAQTSSETKSDHPAAAQSQKEHGSAPKDMKRNDADRASRGASAGASSTGTSPSDSKAASDTKSSTSKPASAQDSTSPPRSNAAQSTDKASDKSTSKSSDTASEKSNDKSHNSTNAARQDDKSTASDRSMQGNEPRDSKSNTAGQTDTKEPSTQRSAADSKSESTPRISASLKTEQKTRLQQAVTKLDVKPVTNVNFSVAVGTAVPRTVSLHRVPTTIVEIVPQYRDYDYFVVRDEVIIVHPETHKIVDVIERGRGSSHASVSTTREERVHLSDKQRNYIRQHATARRTTTTTTTGSAPRASTTIVVGEEVPQSVEIESFPEDVYREVPTVREYRYIRSGSNVYLVDPGTRHVIEEIE